MQDDGLIPLPISLTCNNNGKSYRRRTRLAEPKFQPHRAPTLIDALILELVTKSAQLHLWNEYIDRYHYFRPHPFEFGCTPKSLFQRHSARKWGIQNLSFGLIGI